MMYCCPECEDDKEDGTPKAEGKAGDTGRDSLGGQRTLLRTYRDTTADFSGPTFPSTAAADTTTWTYDPAAGVLLQKLYADNKGPTYT
jgi:hypothetical protein